MKLSELIATGGYDFDHPERFCDEYPILNFRPYEKEGDNETVGKVISSYRAFGFEQRTIIMWVQAHERKFDEGQKTEEQKTIERLTLENKKLREELQKLRKVFSIIDKALHDTLPRMERFRREIV